MGYEASGFVHMVLEMHYDNPEHVSGVRDRSGFKISYTPKLRQHDAAVMTLGDPFTLFKDIPPGKDAVSYEVNFFLFFFFFLFISPFSFLFLKFNNQ
jgi:hypothetical protein